MMRAELHAISSTGIAPLGLEGYLEDNGSKFDNKALYYLNTFVHSKRFRNWKIEEVRQAVVKRKNITDLQSLSLFYKQLPSTVPSPSFHTTFDSSSTGSHPFVNRYCRLPA